MENTMTRAETTQKAKIFSMIEQVRTSAKSFNDLVQDTAILIIQHASLYSDCEGAKQLVRAVPSRLQNMLVGYFRLYSPIGVLIGKKPSDDKNRFVTKEALLAFRERMRLEGPNDQIIDVSKWPTFYIDGARANKWYEDPARVAPERPALDGTEEAWTKIETFLERLLKDAQKDDEKARYDEKERPLIIEMVNNLQRIIKREHVRQAEKLASNVNPPEKDEDIGVTGETNVIAGPKPHQQRQSRQPKKNVKAASVH